MKILFVASRFPYPLLQGDRVRAYHQLRLLSQRHSITLVAPIQTQEEYAGIEILKQFCQRIELVKISKIERILNLVQIPFSSLPGQVLYFSNHSFSKRVQRLLQQESFDILHVQLVRMAPLAVEVSSVPKVLDFIDALSLNMSRRAQAETGLLAKIAQVEAERLLQYERFLTQDFEQLLICSPIDQKYIGKFTNLKVLPLGVDTKQFKVFPEKRNLKKVIFTGKMSYFPNNNAVEYLIEEIFPLIQKQVPDVQMMIVGPGLPKKLARKCQDLGVFVTGFVPNLSEYLSQATVAIAPMRSGSGMQFKVLEAMAAGTPVVATSYALGGLNAEVNKHLLVGDSPETFAAQVVKLLNNPELQAEIAENAYQFIAKNFSWERSVQQLEVFYEQAIEKYHKKLI